MSGLTYRIVGAVALCALDALERALYVFKRIPQSDGPAVRTAGWVLGFRQFGE